MTSFITQVATVSLISLTTFFLYIKYKLNANIAQIKKLAPSLPIVVQTFHFVHPLFQRLLPTSLRAISTDQLLNNPYQYYKILGSDNFILVHAFGYYLHVADYSIAKEITTSQSKFPKAPEMYRVINLFGPNIVGTEGVEWRRHRKIAAPQFGEKTNQLVAYEVNRTCNLMFQSWNKKSIDGKTRVDIVKDLAEFALCIFSGAAFGKSLDFGIDSKLDDGHLIDYKTSVTTVATNIPLYLVIPNLLLKSPIKFFRNVDLAMEEFKNYLNELIDAAKAEKQVRDNLLSKFVDATFSTTKSNFIDEFMTKEEQLKSTPLSRQELVGGNFKLI